MVIFLISELNLWHLDDGTISDTTKVLDDLRRIISESERIGLNFNFKKCEINISGSSEEQTIFEDFQSVTAGIRLMTRKNSTLLGFSLTEELIEVVLKNKIHDFDILSSHYAFILLRILSPLQG